MGGIKILSKYDKMIKERISKLHLSLPEKLRSPEHQRSMCRHRCPDLWVHGSEAAVLYRSAVFHISFQTSAALLLSSTVQHMLVLKAHSKRQRFHLLLLLDIQVSCRSTKVALKNKMGQHNDISTSHYEKKYNNHFLDFHCALHPWMHDPLFSCTPPLTTMDAVVTRLPQQHLYVPLSWLVRSWIWSCTLHPSCFVTYLFPGLSLIAPFFHCTSTPGLESSQHRKAVSPSSASWLWSSSQKKRGCSGKRQMCVKGMLHPTMKDESHEDHESMKSWMAWGWVDFHIHLNYSLFLFFLILKGHMGLVWKVNYSFS